MDYLGIVTWIVRYARQFTSIAQTDKLLSFIIELRSTWILHGLIQVFFPSFRPNPNGNPGIHVECS